MRNDILPPDLNDALADLPDEQRRRLTHTWHALENTPWEGLPEGAPSDGAAWADLEARLAPNGVSRARMDRPPARSRRTWVRPAFILAAVLVLSIAVALMWSHGTVTVITTPGEQASVTLPDGSEVRLVGDSVVRYQRLGLLWLRGPADRNVELQGEAFFDVAAAGRPFVVHTHNAEVEVVGTAFNVRARDDESTPRTEVAVERGHVLVRLAGANGEPVALTARQHTAVVDGRVSPAASLSSKQVASWRDGGFAIRNLPLADVLREVERRFGVAVRIHPRVSPDRTLTLYYHAAVDPETVIHDLALALDLQYRVLRGGFELVPPADN